MIVAEQSTEAFSPYHVPRLTTYSSLWRDEPVVETLMISFSVIVLLWGSSKHQSDFSVVLF